MSDIINKDFSSMGALPFLAKYAGRNLHNIDIDLIEDAISILGGEGHFNHISIKNSNDMFECVLSKLLSFRKVCTLFAIHRHALLAYCAADAPRYERTTAFDVIAWKLDNEGHDCDNDEIASALFAPMRLGDKIESYQYIVQREVLIKVLTDLLVEYGQYQTMNYPLPVEVGAFCARVGK